MAEGCLKVLKYILFAFNFIFWLLGCVILGLGIYLLVANNFGALFPSLPSLSIANVLIIVGSVTMVVAFVGYMGAIKENKCLLLSFFILLLLILMVEVVVAIMLFFYEIQIDEYVQRDMRDGLKKLEKANNTGLSDAWNQIQSQLKCCGVVNHTDWGRNVPASCCLDNKNPCTDFVKEGCYEKFRNWFDGNFLLVGIIIICVSIIQVLGMSFAMTMYCQISSNYKCN
ncbi:leukocyte surface antigen CD53 isoform X1 [Callorhinchus milii]|uniref:Tetraspanin n=1 Tax=Callorhinchus milii TaxID=7868 RepID=K4FY32_CALMI|nr:leukocyte surface antigen CD53 [Callorhinchus milii]XP_007899786.1 leukocyte surface antigen CD53 isoform X1 [Callorhinchus milii]AFK10882.1 leukocyte surface antigen CD53-like protein [Callorhinchus milii]|eukprot:gi/632967087/ref/XP_007899785.1/ PREDICTED: leukocyte surface antigen CD53 [Callorhinchus milii]